ncbi:type IV secretion system protein [Jiangella sp. DSM 45060]|uniref:type IV secretion system protein n=1 Tax=Jiangella sp. DSM 45060 TaxID=1798224 RepID=UPI000B8855E2|nr:type IV secretion system protein [Jiangella sp. DSM 45060]
MMPAFDVCEVPIIGGGCTILEGPGGWFEDMITAAAGAVFGFAMSLMSWIWNLITTTTSPHTDASFVYEWAGRVFGIALPITVGFLVIQIVTLLLRNRSGAGIPKAVVLAGVAVLGTAASVPIIHLFTTAVDGVSHDLTAITFGDLDSVGDRFTEILSTVLDTAGAMPGQDGANYAVLGGGSVVAGAFGFIVFGIFLVFGALAVFAALLVRTMLLDIAVVIGPLAIMGLAWDKTHGWFRKWISLVVALIFTKLAVMIVFGLGVSGLESLSFSTDGAGVVGVLLTSTLMLMLAALVPVACFKFMSFIGDEIEAGHLHGAGTAAAARGAQVAGRANPAQIMHTRSSAASTVNGGATAGGGTRSTPAPPSGQPATGTGGAAAATGGGDTQPPETPPNGTGGRPPGSGASGGGGSSTAAPVPAGRGAGRATGAATAAPGGVATASADRPAAPASTIRPTAAPHSPAGPSSTPASPPAQRPAPEPGGGPAAAERTGPDLTRPN